MPRRKLTATKRRAAPRRRKLTTTQTVKSPRIPQATAKQALAYIHPFAGTGIQPKIHDDSSQLSIGVSNKFVTQFDSGNIQRGATIDILLFPGLNGSIVTNTYMDSNVTDANGNPTEGPMSDLIFGNGYCMGHDEHGSGLVNSVVPVNDDPLQIWNNTDITSWRQVSKGMKLQLLNTDETNDGWFECCRFKMNQDNRQMCITPSLANTQQPIEDDRWFVHPKLGFMKRELDDYMVQEPSYVRGRLKDIHKFQFNLQHFDRDHPFQMLPSRIALADMVWNDQRKGIIENAAATGLFSDGGHLNDTVSNFNYKTMDCIYLKIHPGATGSQLLCDVVSNQECVYHPTSVLSNFQQGTNKKKKDDFKKLVGSTVGAIHAAGTAYLAIKDDPKFRPFLNSFGHAGTMQILNQMSDPPPLGN